MLPDYYKILDLNRNATLLEIKKAFRKKAMEFHPDKNKSPNAQELFIEINQAYEVLSNPIKRKKYDYMYSRQEFQAPPKYSQEKEQRWEETMRNAKQKGQEKAEQYSQDYDYFSKRVLKTAGIELLIEIVLSLIFDGIYRFGLAMGLLWFIIGIIITIKGYQSNRLYIGLLLTIIGFIIIRNRYIEIVKGED